jgi:hypothetical protein
MIRRSGERGSGTKNNERAEIQSRQWTMDGSKTEPKAAGTESAGGCPINALLSK